MTVDLFQFVVDRIGEDEAVARAAGSDTWTTRVAGPHENDFIVASSTDDRSQAETSVVSPVAREAAVHIARHCPARVLDHCTAKRLMIANAQFRTGSIQADAILTYLALPYRDHPDYNAEWTP